MGNPFVAQDKYARFFGGSAGEAPLDAYVSGFHYMFFVIPLKLQEAIYKQIVAAKVPENDDSIFGGPNQIANILNIHNTTFTPAGTTLNKTTVNAMGGRKWNVPTSLDVADSISVSYNEYSGLPIYKIHKYWVAAIRNKDLGGISNLTGSDDGFLSKEEYSARLYYATVRPDGKSIETAQLYTGVFPTKVPTDSFGSDIANSDKIDISIDYSHDHLYDNQKEVTDQVQAYIGTALSTGIAANKSRISNVKQ